MAYLEPGAYLKFKDMGALQGGGAPLQLPLIIGTGADTIIVSETITRGTGDFDLLPNANWKTILSVGYTEGASDFEKTTDYTFDQAQSKLTWTMGGSKPTEAETYVVVGECDAPESRYTLRLVYPDTYRDIYGQTDFVDADGTKLNKLVVGLKALFNSGASVAYALQVKPAGGLITDADYQKALAKVRTVSDVYRVVPVDLGNTINAAVDSHVNSCSSYEERMERVARYSAEASPATFDEVLTSVGGFAEGKASRRVCVPYPNKAMMMLTDGELHEVDGAIISCALAGLQSSMPGYQSTTRSTISAFDSLVGLEMTRTEKNKLAEKGVTILEQPAGKGTPIMIRHQLTTDMSSVAKKEASITTIRDHVAKSLRAVAEAYIGKYNITPDTITRVTGSLKSTIQDLVQEGWILETSQLTSVAQDINNPDTLIVEAKVDVPYPCNYIKITVLAD